MDWIFTTIMFIVDVNFDGFLDSWGEITLKLRYYMVRIFDLFEIFEINSEFES